MPRFMLRMLRRFKRRESRHRAWHDRPDREEKTIADQIAESEKTVLPTSTERATRRRILGAVFKGGEGVTYKIGFQRADGSKFDVSICQADFARSA